MDPIEYQPEPRLVTAEEAAVMLRCSVRTVANHVERGRLTPVRNGARHVRYDADEIAGLAAERVAS